MGNGFAPCRRANVVAVLLLTLSVQGGVAQADDSSPGAGHAAAQSLFDDAKALLARNNWAEACPKLEESQRLQPAGGTLMFLALCREGEGRTATAWTRFNEVMSQARRDGRADRERVAREHIAALGPKLLKLKIMRADASSPSPELVVKLDGEIVSAALLGTAIPVDPGNHAISAGARGMKPWEQIAELSKPGEIVTVTIPALEREMTPAPAPTAKSEPSVVAPQAPSTPAAPPSRTEDETPGGSQRTLALGVGVLGVVGVGVGTVFGFQAMSKKSESDRGCPGGAAGPCTADGVSASKTAVADGNVSTIAFGVGGVALAGAAVLWLTAPKAVSTPHVRLSPRVHTTVAGVDVSGAF